ncbi:MAG TPA: Flp pilus assembly protein CpaB, partial [Candidatus Brocadiia bacterium]|nr:Flp pilus assembly protein CpaB [Candidatus Brocadiia bacterium]
MKNKLALFAAILLGVIAAYGVHSYLKEQARRTESRLQPTAILAYNQRLAKGTVLMPSHVKERTMSRDAITPAHLLLRDRNSVYGMRLIRDVETNSPILWDDFEERNTTIDQGESALRPGYRALTLAVDNISGVAGNLRPGSHVDLYGTFQTAEESAAPARGAGASAARARAPRTI